MLQSASGAGISEMPDALGYRGSLMFHGSSADAIQTIVQVGLLLQDATWSPFRDVASRMLL